MIPHKVHTKTGEVTFPMPKLRRRKFEKAIIVAAVAPKTFQNDSKECARRASADSVRLVSRDP